MQLAVFGLAAIWFGALVTPIAAGDESDPARRSDDAVRLSLFGDPVLRQNAVEICQRARRSPAEQRYEQLLRWVLPADGRGVRMHGGFRRSDSWADQSEVAENESSRDLDAYPESRWMHSPARDLVATASELDRLAELKRRVQAGASEHEGCEALLTLIEIESGDVGAVSQRLEDRFGWQRVPGGADSTTRRWCDLTVLWAAASNPATSKLVTEDLFGVYPRLQYADDDPDVDVVNEYLRMIKGWCHDAVLRSSRYAESSDGPLESSGFESFSIVDAPSHALARPLSRFFIGPEGAHKITGHESDFLVYRSPLTGDFEASCNISTRPGTFSELSVHGVSVQPTEGGKRMRVSRLRQSSEESEVEPPLEEIESESQLRVVVKDGRAGHFFNGRMLHDSHVEPLAAPWVALRSWRRTTSEVRDLRLTGSPSIAASVDLLKDPQLGGWASYFATDSNEGLADWSASASGGASADQPVVLVSGAIAGVAGCYDEDLIRYVRPISWDARIRYECLYRSDDISVHPALGRSVFLIDPDGVRLHRLTDGRDEQTALRADHSIPLEALPGSRLEKPKWNEGWNDVELQILGDTLTLILNGKKVAHTNLPPERSRTFGFFRYRDQTRAAVRRVKLTGAWPRAVPPAREQPLASRLVAELDASAAELDVQFLHDFRDGTPAELFDFNGDETSMRQVADGVRIGRSDGAGIKEMRVSAIIDGDFDIVASYRDLEISTAESTWHCGMGLAIHLENPTQDRCAINRRRDRMHGHHYVGFGQKETNAGGKTTWTGGANVVDESTSGRLRLARRGEMIYGLHAIEDSPVFRVVRATKVPPGRIAIHGLRIVTDNGRGMFTNVTLSDLQIRADDVDFLKVKDQAATLATLDDQRDQKQLDATDLTQQTIDDSQLYLSAGGETDVLADDTGATLSLRSVGESTAKYSLSKRVVGGADFDVQVELDVLQLDQGPAMGRSNEVVLQVRLADPAGYDPTKEELQVYEATLILRHKANGKLDLIPRVVGRGRGGRISYLPIRSIPVRMPDRFRIVHHEKTLYFLYSDIDSDDTRIIATYPLEKKLDATSVILSSIAHGSDLVAKTRWKKIEVFSRNSAPFSGFLRSLIPPAQP